MLHAIPEVLHGVRVLMHLKAGAGWPRGGWLLASALSVDKRREVEQAGYAVMETPDGRAIVEPAG